MEIQVAQKLNIPEIIRAHTKRLSGFIRKRVNRLEDAEDILQEVLYQLAEADRLMQPIERVTAWLFAVARNKITDLYRKKKLDLLAEYEVDEEEGYLMNELGSLLTNDSDGPETQYLRSLVWEEIVSALNDLPAEQRSAYEMTEFEGLSFKEIAKQSGEKVNTLISRKRYAVLFLRERLKILYEELINY